LDLSSASQPPIGGAANLSEQQHPLGLCGIQKALEQDEDFARLNIDVDVDGLLVEPVGSKPSVDFGRSDWIKPPAQSILQHAAYPVRKAERLQEIVREEIANRHRAASSKRGAADGACALRREWTKRP